MAFTIKRDNGSIFIFDATVTHSTSFANTITEFPVETGETISDHIVNQNVTMNFEGVISDAALTTSVFAIDTQNFVDTLSSGNLNIGDLFAAGVSSKGKSALSRELLYTMWREKETFTLEVDNLQYDNVTFESIELPKNVSDANSLRVIGSMKQITVVSTATTSVPKVDLADKVKDSASDKSVKGSGQAKDLDESVLKGDLFPALAKFTSGG